MLTMKHTAQPKIVQQQRDRQDVPGHLINTQPFEQIMRARLIELESFARNELKQKEAFEKHEQQTERTAEEKIND